MQKTAGVAIEDRVPGTTCPANLRQTRRPETQARPMQPKQHRYTISEKKRKVNN